jgi:glutamyl-tRNA reductase
MIVVVGLSHKTAPIEVRERAALSPEAVAELLAELRGDAQVSEALIVSTCNRVEIVAAGRAHELASLPSLVAAVEKAFLRRAQGVDAHVYHYLGPDAVRHVFRVASSLDSLVLGEPQILGQVKAAFDFARQQGSVGSALHRVVGHALRTAKRVRSETTVGAGQVSVPSVAMDLARQIFGTLEGRDAALIGSGQMGESVAKLLTAAGAKLRVVGRNQERITALAKELNAVATPLDELPAVLASADVVVTTTSASEFVVTYDMVAAARRKRRGRSLFMMDLAVPRDIEPRVDGLDGVFLYNVDDLSQIVAETLTQRQREAGRAESIVSDEVHSYARGVSAEQVTPTVVALRQKFNDVFKAELERSLRSKLKTLGHEERQAIEKMLDAALNKALHAPTRKLRELASSKDREDELAESVELLESLFELGPSASLPSALDLSIPEVEPPAPGEVTQAYAAAVDQKKVG